MRKIFFLSVLMLSMISYAAELDYYQTIVTKQQAGDDGQSHVFGLDYYADGSLLLLAN